MAKKIVEFIQKKSFFGKEWLGNSLICTKKTLLENFGEIVAHTSGGTQLSCFKNPHNTTKTPQV